MANVNVANSQELVQIRMTAIFAENSNRISRNGSKKLGANVSFVRNKGKKKCECTKERKRKKKKAMNPYEFEEETGEYEPEEVAYSKPRPRPRGSRGGRGGRSRTPSPSPTPESFLGETGYKKSGKPTERQKYGQWMITFISFFVLAIVVAVFVGWLQEKSGYQPQNLSSFLMFALLFSAIGTLLLNVGIKIFMPKAVGGPALFVVV